MRLAFTASQVNKLELAEDLGRRIVARQVLLLDDECQNAVRATRRLIHIVRGHDLVFDALPKVFKSVFD